MSDALDRKQQLTWEEVVSDFVLVESGGNGKKDGVRAFLSVNKGIPRVNVKYGKKFYNFAVLRATETQRQYNRRNNLE